MIDFEELINTEQTVPFEALQPIQPVKTVPAAGAAIRVIVVPEG